MKNYFILFLAVFVLFAFGCTIPGFGGSANSTINTTENDTHLVLNECPQIDKYVCGKDNITYGTECLAKKAKVEVAYEGPCIVEQCSAEGMNKCNNATSVLDFYCDSNVLKNRTTSCDSNSECAQGSCVKKEPVKPSCISSNPNDIYIKGTVIAATGSYEDKCSSLSAVKKFYCLQNLSVSSSTKNCPSGFNCRDGACVNIPITCIASDKTNSEYVAGTVRVDYGTSSKDYADSCYGETTVLKYSCNGSTLSSRTIDCPSHSVCSSHGTCTDACWDTDGNDQLVSGKVVITTRDGFTTDYRDVCYTAEQVTEYFCNEGQAVSVLLSCGSDSYCFSGGCIKKDTTNRDTLSN
ncbi:MAG: hypothetical protein Q7S22_00240 [Candidatus Micrarchaeota archaeon]|nr:hypothetical protein [Candidatus Micrarchaeota archaeon]